MTTPELVSSTRRALRRHVNLSCDVLSEQGDVRTGRVYDLSAKGARVRAVAKAALREELLMTFRAPGIEEDISTLVRVARVHELNETGGTLLSSRGVAELGVEFLELSHPLAHRLERALRGYPPPVPRGIRPFDLRWADVTVSWEEELDDSLLTYEATERVALLDDGDMVHEVALQGPAVAWPLHWRRTQTTDAA